MSMRRRLLLARTALANASGPLVFRISRRPLGGAISEMIVSKALVKSNEKSERE